MAVNTRTIGIIAAGKTEEGRRQVVQFAKASAVILNIHVPPGGRQPVVIIVYCRCRQNVFAGKCCHGGNGNKTSRGAGCVDIAAVGKYNITPYLHDKYLAVGIFVPQPCIASHADNVLQVAAQLNTVHATAKVCGPYYAVGINLKLLNRLHKTLYGVAKLPAAVAVFVHHEVAVAGFNQKVIATVGMQQAHAGAACILGAVRHF